MKASIIDGVMHIIKIMTTVKPSKFISDILNVVLLSVFEDTLFYHPDRTDSSSQTE